MEYNYAYNEEVKKVKVTMTLTPQVLKNLDKMAQRLKTKSRSETIEKALRQWLESQARKKLESDVETYYQSLTPKEKQEDIDWSATAARGARHLWD